ncbi:FtsW/RodA/SpoVE family cell cycle protein [Nostoc sp.]
MHFFFAIRRFYLPSERIKPFLVLQSARLFGQWERISWRVRFAWLGVFGLVLLGILAQPNLILFCRYYSSCYWPSICLTLQVPGRNKQEIVIVMLALLSISIKEYQRKRVMSFLNPWDATGDGYQLVQSLLAVGSGRVWQWIWLSLEKLFYLPIQDTDFIFAVFAEEFGFVGSMVLLVLLATFRILGLVVALKAKNIVRDGVVIGRDKFDGRTIIAPHRCCYRFSSDYWLTFAHV